MLLGLLRIVSEIVHFSHKCVVLRGMIAIEDQRRVQQTLFTGDDLLDDFAHVLQDTR